MLHLRKAICLILMALLLAQPVVATEAATETTPREPDIVTAVRKMDKIPTEFDIHTKITEELRWLRSLTASPLYAMTGGNWEPVVAAQLPEDVTGEYVGSYGIPADSARGYAYRITLKDDARWENGTFITADDCVFSILEQFSHKDTVDNWLFLANGEAVREGRVKPSRHIISLKEAGFPSITQAWAAGFREFFLDTEGYWGLGQGWKSISDRIRIRDYAMPTGLDESFISPAYLYHNYLMDGEHHRFLPEFIGISENSGSVYTTEDLGLVKLSEKEFVIILEDSITASTLMQHLEELVLFSEYADTCLSSGPYRIVSATSEELWLEPNPCWWGEPDPRGYDRIFCQKIGT